MPVKTTKLSAPDVDTNPYSNGLESVAPAQTIMDVSIQGVARMLFHRYDCGVVEAKGGAAKGSKTKKTDDIDGYVYRDEAGNLCVPADVVQSSIIISGKSFQDPRSPRKSAMDLMKAGILVLPDMIPLKKPDGKVYRNWDFTDTRRVKIQQAAISRTRPGVEAGWTADFQIVILLPELISPEFLRTVLANAGAVCGLCDYRPRFGRFQIVGARTVGLK